MAIGTFTAVHVNAAATDAHHAPEYRRVRTAKIQIAASTNTGYSFAAAPSPMSEPASTGFRRAHAQIEQLVSAIASRSQFENAWMISSGDSAKIAASYGRRRAVCTVAVVTISPHTLSSSAVSPPKTTIVDQLCTTESTPRVRSAVTSMNAPVSTGYSTVVSRYGTAPTSSRSSCHNGTTSE